MAILPAGLSADVLALGIQQPWVELILRGLKTVEVRTQATQVRGEIYVYSSKRVSLLDAADRITRQHSIDVESLPRGLLCGRVELVDCRPMTRELLSVAGLPTSFDCEGCFAWVLANPDRFPKPHPVRFLPYGVWFYPYRRKSK
jgi:hypothetical protein